MSIGINTFIDAKRSKRKGFRCQVCLFEGRMGAVLRYVVICRVHSLHLCVVSRPRASLYNDDGDKFEDFNWMALDGWSCWDKAHKYYIPKGLFYSSPPPILDNEQENPCFQKARVSSRLYTAKRLAFGKNPVKRGQKRHKGPGNQLGDLVTNLEEVEVQNGNDDKTEDENTISTVTEEPGIEDIRPRLRSPRLITNENIDVTRLAKI